MLYYEVSHCCGRLDWPDFGSLTWRLARGEMGGDSARDGGNVHKPYVIVPTEEEIGDKKLILQYDPVTDIQWRGRQRTNGKYVPGRV